MIRNDTFYPGELIATKRAFTMSSNIRLTKICQHCRQEFIAKTMHTRYCSHTCNRRAYKQEQRAQKIQVTLVQM